METPATPWPLSMEAGMPLSATRVEAISSVSRTTPSSDQARCRSGTGVEVGVAAVVVQPVTTSSRSGQRRALVVAVADAGAHAVLVDSAPALVPAAPAVLAAVEAEHPEAALVAGQPDLGLPQHSMYRVEPRQSASPTPRRRWGW